MTTKQRLADALREAGAPAQMVERALAGNYDDYESDSATPIVNLVRDLNLVGLWDLAKRVMDGEFDAPKDEAQSWYQREGKDLIERGLRWRSQEREAVREKANYITCPKGHKVYVIWSSRFKKFGFHCDECNEHAVRAFSPMTGHLVEVRIVRRLKQGERVI